MPHFHFHLRDGSGLGGRRGDCVELPDIATAKDEAVRFAAALLLESPHSFWNGHEWGLDVTDEAGLMLFSLTFFATNAPVTQVRHVTLGTGASPVHYVPVAGGDGQ